MQSWGEHSENHSRFMRKCLDDIAKRHLAGEPIPVELIAILTPDEIDYLYLRDVEMTITRSIFHSTFAAGTYILAALVGTSMALLASCIGVPH
jgi:hypothetical protein